MAALEVERIVKPTIKCNFPQKKSVISYNKLRTYLKGFNWRNEIDLSDVNLPFEMFLLILSNN